MWWALWSNKHLHNDKGTKWKQPYGPVTVIHQRKEGRGYPKEFNCHFIQWKESQAAFVFKNMLHSDTRTRVHMVICVYIYNINRRAWRNHHTRSTNKSMKVAIRDTLNVSSYFINAEREKLTTLFHGNLCSSADCFLSHSLEQLQSNYTDKACTKD